MVDNYQIVKLNKFRYKKEIIRLNQIINPDRDNAAFEAEIHVAISSYLRGIIINKKLVCMIMIHHSHINNLGCDPDYQNKGLASCLLKQAQNDFDELTLEVDPHNIKAFNLYSKFNFVTTGIYPSNKYLVMEWSKNEDKMQEITRKHHCFMVK
ncbi:MAG: GNAT family N-acetyltransferase [Traorella sp.]